MDLIKTGKIYDLKCFKSPLRRGISTESSVNDQGKSILMEKTSASFGEVFETSSRFEQVFLASPRAKELYSAFEKTKQKPNPSLQRPTPQKSPTDKNVTGKQRLSPQKSTTSKSVPGFDKVVNMADFFHNKTSRSSSSHSAVSDHSLTFGKPSAFSDLFKDFEESPFKRSVNDSAIKQKVSMVISRLEDNSTTQPSTSQNKTKTNAPVHAMSRDSGFNDVQSDSGGSSEGAFTDIMNRRSRETSVKGGISTRAREVNNTVSAQTVHEQEVHISFESNSSDEEIDVVTDGDHPEDDGDGEDNNNNLTTENRELSVEQAEGVPKTRSRKTQNQEKTDTKRTNKVESSQSSTSSDKNTQQTSKINSLKQWSVKALKTRTHMGIIVEGQRSEDPVGELWHSTAIVTRLNSRCVQTKSGSQYKLIGPINEDITLKQGFPPAFVKAFKNGFPQNWLPLVADYFNSLNSSESEEDDKKIEEQPEKKKGKVSKRGRNPTAVTHTPTESSAKKRNKTTAFKTPENRSLPKEVEVKTTRSGRMVKPQLAWWRGQRILTDKDHNLEGIDPGGMELTALSSMYNVDIKLPIKSEESSPLKRKMSTSGREKTTSSTRPSNRKHSSDSSSERDTDESVRKPLFVSPKKIPNKNQSLQKSSSGSQSPHEERSAGTSIVQGNSKTKSARNNDLRTQGLSPRKQPRQDREVVSEDELPTQVIVEEKSTSANSSIKENRSRTRRKDNRKLCTDSESDVVELTAPKVPSPPKRVLRSRDRKVVLIKVDSDTDKFSEVDSEESKAEREAPNSRRQTRSRRGINTASDSENKSSCDEKLDNAGYSGKAPRAAAGSKKKNLEKKPVHKRINELAKEPSAPSSDEDSDGTSNKQTKKMPGHPRSAKVVKENTESASENERKVEKGSSKRKTKAESESESASAKKQSLKVDELAKQTSAQSSDEDSDGTSNKQTKKKPVHPRSSKAAKENNESASENERKVEKGSSKRKTKPESENENASAKKQALKVDELTKQTSAQSSDDDSDGTSNKQTKKKPVHPRSSKAAKENNESASENERKVEKGSSKRKTKGESESENVSAKKQALKVFKQTSNKNNKKRKDVMSESEAPWTQEEIQTLNNALYTIPGNTPMFWQKVSREVGSRTAEECQFQHQGQVLVSNKKDPSVKSKGSAKDKKEPGQKAASQQSVKTVTGGVGTIKRKRELRELLEQQDVDYEDDIFDSTPFKKKKDLKLPFNLSAHSSDEGEDDDDDDNESDAEHSMSSKTPSSRTPSSRFRPLGPLSISATPGAEFVSPSLLQQVNRKDMDHYIYRMQQGKRGTQVPGRHKSKPLRTSTPKKPSTNSGLPALSSELFEAHPASDHESDEDKDYYFSDE